MAGKRQNLVGKVFLDSSVIFSAVNSPTGGSAKLFTLKNIQLFTSPVVMTETEKNIRLKLTSFQLERFLSLAEKLQIVDQKPDLLKIEQAKKVTAEKDAVILAEVKKAKMDLVTLDQKHLLTPEVKRFLKPKSAFMPGEIIQEDLKRRVAKYAGMWSGPGYEWAKKVGKPSRYFRKRDYWK